MTNQKRMLALLLSAMLCTAAVTGCGEAKQPASDPASTLPEGTSEGDNPAEDVSLRFVVQLHDLSIEPDQMPVYQQLEEQTGIHVEFETVRGSNWLDKKATLFASQELPDAFMSQGIEDSDIMANKSLFVPLNDYIENSPNIKKMFDDNPQAKAASTFPDGNIYSLPQIDGYRPKCVNVMMINQKWLEAVGMEQPKTLEELKQVLIAFRDKDPNGNGKKDEIAMDWQNMGFYDAFSALDLIGSWGVTDTNVYHMSVEDSKVSAMYTKPEYKELVQFLAGLWSENLINPEVFTQDYTMFQSTAQNPDAATVGFTFGWEISNRVGKWADEYVAMPPMTAEGYTGTPYFNSNPVAQKISTNKFEMTSSNQHPEETMRYMDAIYDGDKMSMQVGYGAIGTVFEETESGYKMLKPTDGLDFGAFTWTNSLCGNAPFYWSEALTEKVEADSSYEARIKQDETFHPYIKDIETVYPMVKFDEASTNELSLIRGDIDPYITNQFAKWVSGGDPAVIDQEWDAYLAQLKNMQLDRMVEIYQSGYNQYYGK